MPIVRINPRREVAEFYPWMLAPRSLTRAVVDRPPTYRAMRSRGMAGSSPQQINAMVTTGASSAVGILAGLSLIPGPGWVAGAISGAIALGSMIANMFHGCGQTCILATQDANKYEPVLQQNLQQYLALPVHYKSLQLAYLNNFDTLWNGIHQACSDPSLGAAGERCISDRQQGACKYHTSPGGWQQDASGTWKYVYNGPNGSGSTCWNWFVGYRDPISNDPTVVPDPTPQPISNIVGDVTGAVSNAASSLLPSGLVPSGFSFSNLLIPGGLLAAGLLFAFSSGGRR